MVHPLVANRVMAVPSGALVRPSATTRAKVVPSWALVLLPLVVVTQAMAAPMAVEEVILDGALPRILEGFSVAFAKAAALGPLAAVVAMALGPLAAVLAMAAASLA